uniref:Uncharacterized protein n=1 Tax=Panagrolaimus superbus TaxID=310955 RepID=A0A914YL86_9BILA
MHKYNHYYTSRGFKYLCRASKYITEDEYQNECKKIIDGKKFHDGPVHAVTADFGVLESIVESEARNFKVTSFFQFLLNLYDSNPAIFIGTQLWSMRQAVYIAEIMAALLCLKHAQNATVTNSFLDQITQMFESVIGAGTVFEAFQQIRQTYGLEGALTH